MTNNNNVNNELHPHPPPPRCVIATILEYCIFVFENMDMYTKIVLLIETLQKKVTAFCGISQMVVMVAILEKNSSAGIFEDLSVGTLVTFLKISAFNIFPGWRDF